MVPFKLQKFTCFCIIVKFENIAVRGQNLGFVNKDANATDALSFQLDFQQATAIIAFYRLDDFQQRHIFRAIAFRDNIVTRQTILRKKRRGTMQQRDQGQPCRHKDETDYGDRSFHKVNQLFLQILAHFSPCIIMSQ